MKKYRIGLLTTIMVCLFATMSYAANPTGQSGDVAGPVADVDALAPAPDFCAEFPFSGFNFVLEVNRDGTGHMRGDWCQDWNPTGIVNVVDAGNKRTVTFELQGTKPSEGCCDDTCISGKLIYKLSKDKLKKATITWGFPIECSAPCDSFTFSGSKKQGLKDCR